MQKIGKLSATLALLAMFTLVLSGFVIKSDACIHPCVVGNCMHACFTYNVGAYSGYHLVAYLEGEGDVDAGSVEVYDDNSYIFIRAVVWSKPYLAYGELDKNGDGILDDPSKNRDDLSSDGITITIRSGKCMHACSDTYTWKVGKGKQRDSQITVPSWNNDIGPATPNILSGPIVYLAKILIPTCGRCGGSFEICLNVHASPPGPIECPFPCAEEGVSYLGNDTVTQGDWTNATGSPIGVYGSYAHILPNPPTHGAEIPVGHFETPLGDYPWNIPGGYPWDYHDLYGWTWTQIAGLPYNRTDPPYWDEYVTLNPPITYYLTGTPYNMPGIGLIQYPVFEWAWEDNFNSTDPRAALFEVCADGGRKLTIWDDGSERGFPSEGYFNVTLTFPDGCFMLSLYAYDMERDQRDNQTIYITDEAGTVLASGIIQGQEFDEGIYLQFTVHGPTTIVVQVKKSPGSVNALLSGIFVDLLPPCPPCGECKCGVTELTLVYLGVEAAFVEVNDGELFAGTVEPGEDFTFTGEDGGDMGSNIDIDVNHEFHVSIHTSCSQPIGPGLIKGDFMVVAGKSEMGGPLCPVTSPCLESNVFCLTSNSIVSKLVFNSTSQELSFTVTGPSDTTGYVKAYIAKTLIKNINEVKVYLDGNQADYTAVSLDGLWLLYFTYKHSTHKITITLGATHAPAAETLLKKAVIYATLMTAVIALAIIYHLRRHTRPKISTTLSATYDENTLKNP